ncbi:MAG TPA: adenylate/guanylate cyclase domain-containing protein, partial [Micavibrio sp.]
MSVLTPRVFYTIIALFIVNILPLVGWRLHYYPIGQAFYFYWAECAMLGGLAVIMHAKRMIAFIVILLAAATIVNALTPEAERGGDISVLLVFWALYGLCWVAYMELSKSYMGLRAQPLHPIKQFFLYILFMIFAIFACFTATITIYNGWDLTGFMPLQLYLLYVSIAIIVPTLSIALLRVVDMVGTRHFFPFFLGTYHTPVERDRIVMFIDMVGSSGAAEILKPREGLGLISRFIFDAGMVIRQRGGDIVNYTGDGLVVIWKRHQASKALESIKALRSRIRSREEMYRNEYGVVPDFRVGIHAGIIAIGQIGEEKLFLGVYGDVVNTAARLEQMNKDFNTRVTVSSEVYKALA